jgi:transglutaminase-like putative cysteine protease
VKAPAPNLARLLATSAALAAAALPHVGHFPAWVSALVAGAIAWRLAAEQRGWALPPRWARLAAALFATLAVLARYHTVNGLDAGTALLAAMAALKLTETRAPRDHAVLVFIGYFLCLATLLYGQTFPRLAYTLVTAWLLTAALARVHRPVEANTPVRPFRVAARLLGLGLPLAAVLFLFVPRIEGRFWAVPAHASRHASGIDEQMSPGDIAELGLSDDPAFRVWFRGRPPPPELRYWRVLVLEEFDGRVWRRRGDGDGGGAEVAAAGPLVDYRIVLEPTERSWLPALDTVTDWPRNLAARSSAASLVYTEGGMAERRGVTNRLSYALRSDLGAHLAPSGLSVAARHRDLGLPAASAPRTRALAATLRATAGDDRAYVNAVLARFRNEPFSYTLSPPLLGAEPVDEFLFGTRAGFCEHYASAFTVLMRAAGIPARVVIGYQGGEANSYGGYLLVRSASAHAWSEVWLAGSGWTRVDPTAAVAPERVNRGELTEDIAGDSVPGRLFADLPWLGNLRAAFDAVRTAWNENVVGFSPQLQMRVVAALGLGANSWAGLAIALTAGFVLAALALAGWLAWELRPRRRDPVLSAWAQLGARLATLGVAPAPAEGPLDYAARVALALPALGTEVTELGSLYVAARYLPAATGDERARFLAAAARFLKRPAERRA